MGEDDAIILDRLASLGTTPTKMPVYDREIGVRLLYEDPVSGAEHYLIRYPPGMRARRHRHTPAQTIVVLEGQLAVDDAVIGPGSYCHFPPGVPMFHAPRGEEGCLFVTIFHGPADVEALDD